MDKNSQIDILMWWIATSKGNGDDGRNDCSLRI